MHTCMLLHDVVIGFSDKSETRACHCAAPPPPSPRGVQKENFENAVATFKKDNIRSMLDAMLREFQENCGDSLIEENLISR